MKQSIILLIILIAIMVIITVTGQIQIRRNAPLDATASKVAN